MKRIIAPAVITLLLSGSAFLGVVAPTTAQAAYYCKTVWNGPLLGQHQVSGFCHTRAPGTEFRIKVTCASSSTGRAMVRYGLWKRQSPNFNPTVLVSAANCPVGGYRSHSYVFR